MNCPLEMFQQSYCTFTPALPVSTFFFFSISINICSRCQVQSVFADEWVSRESFIHIFLDHSKCSTQVQQLFFEIVTTIWKQAWNVCMVTYRDVSWWTGWGAQTDPNTRVRNGADFSHSCHSEREAEQQRHWESDQFWRNAVFKHQALLM